MLNMKRSEEIDMGATRLARMEGDAKRIGMGTNTGEERERIIFL